MCKLLVKNHSALLLKLAQRAGKQFLKELLGWLRTVPLLLDFEESAFLNPWMDVGLCCLYLPLSVQMGILCSNGVS